MVSARAASVYFFTYVCKKTYFYLHTFLKFWKMISANNAQNASEMAGKWSYEEEKSICSACGAVKEVKGKEIYWFLCDPYFYLCSCRYFENEKINTGGDKVTTLFFVLCDIPKRRNLKPIFCRLSIGEVYETTMKNICY